MTIPNPNLPFNKQPFAGSSWATNEMAGTVLHSRDRDEQGRLPLRDFSPSPSPIRAQAVAPPWLSAVVEVVLYLFVTGVLTATGVLLVRDHHLASALLIAFPLSGLTGFLSLRRACRR